MTHRLFVYGTLMPGARDRIGRRVRACLSAAGVWRGAASLEGRLYDLGGYPGLVEGAGGDGATVSGALIELAKPDEVFCWLDRYEGIDPRQPGAGDYRRVTRSVKGRMGVVEAWVYVCPAAPRGATPIAGGDWLAFGAAKTDSVPSKP